MKQSGYAIGMAFLIIATAAALFPVLRGEFLNWDDEENVVYCPRLRNLSCDNLPWYFTNFIVGDFKPLVWFTYNVDRWFWDLNPVGYHLENLLLHILSSGLVFVLLIRLGTIGGILDPREGILPVLVAALWFAVHPLRVENTAWISDRKDCLCLFFYLAAVLAYLRFARRGSVRRYLAALLLALLAALAKPTAATLPAVLLLLDWYPLRRFTPAPGRAMLEKIPFLLVALGTAAMGFFGQAHRGALVGWSEFGASARFLVAGHTIVLYLEKTILPFRLAGAYPVPAGPSLFRPAFFASFILLASLSCLSVARARAGRPWLGFCWLWFLLTVAPVTGLLRTGLIVAADRFTYLPGLAVSLAFLPVFSLLRGRLNQAAVPLLLAAPACLVGLSWRQSLAWHDSETVWRESVKQQPGSPVSRSHLGQVLYSKGDDRGAEEHLRAALELMAGSGERGEGMEFAARSNLARTLARAGKPAEAEALFKEILKNHDEWYIHHSLAGLYRRMNRDREAAEEYQKVLREKPGFCPALCDYGLLLAQGGQTESAVTLYRRALLAAPGSPRARYNLALALLDRGDGPNGVRLLEELNREYPDNSQVARALLVAYGAGRQPEKAEALKRLWPEERLRQESYLPYTLQEKPGLMEPLYLHE